MSGLSENSGFNPTLLAQAAQGSATMSNMATKTNVVQAYNSQAGANAKFPAQISSTDPEDEKWALRQQVIGAGGVDVKGVGIAVAGDDFFQYAKRKMDSQQEAAFKEWVMKNADLNDPAQAAWWYEKIPWMKESREDYIKYVANLQMKDALITLNGPQSEDDFRFLFLKQQNLIHVPEKPLNQLNELTAQPSYVQGFFSPFSASLLSGRFPVAQYKADGKFQWSSPTATTGLTAFGGGNPLKYNHSANPMLYKPTP